MKNNFRVLAFDLDGTLTESKQRIKQDIASRLTQLVDDKFIRIAIVSGGKWEQFEKQLIPYIRAKNLDKFVMLPTCGASMYRWYPGSGWTNIYEERLTDKEKDLIESCIMQVMEDTLYKKPLFTYGKVIEDRETQITFSALGQRAPLELKEKWDPDYKIRKVMVRELKKLLPNLEITYGGTTSIDITKKGIDKAYAMQKLMKELGVKKESILFLGDALDKNGNDYPVKRMGIKSIHVKDINDTKNVLDFILGLEE